MVKKVAKGASVKKATKVEREKAYRERVLPGMARIRKAEGLIVCHIPRGCTVKRNKIGNSYRLSVSGVDTRAEKLVYYVKKSHKTVSDVFQICGDVGCCRPSHLSVETTKDNKDTRRGCYGYLKIPGEDRLYKVCPHQPTCRKVTGIDSIERVDPQEIDPQDDEDVEDIDEFGGGIEDEPSVEDQVSQILDGISNPVYPKRRKVDEYVIPKKEPMHQRLRIFAGTVTRLRGQARQARQARQTR
jgi:hypothetical protein